MYRGFGVKGVQNSDSEGMEAKSNQTDTNGNQRKNRFQTETNAKTDCMSIFVPQGEGREGGRSLSHSLMTPTEGGRRTTIIFIIIYVYIYEYYYYY